MADEKKAADEKSKEPTAEELAAAAAAEAERADKQAALALRLQFGPIREAEA